RKKVRAGLSPTAMAVSSGFLEASSDHLGIPLKLLAQQTFRDTANEQQSVESLLPIDEQLMRAAAVQRSIAAYPTPAVTVQRLQQIPRLLGCSVPVEVRCHRGGTPLYAKARPPSSPGPSLTASEPPAPSLG